MRKSSLVLSIALPALLLAGCKARFETKDDDHSGNVAIAMGGNDSGAVSIDTPVFKADVKLPGLNLGGDHIDIDGMKLYPGSSVTGVNVNAQDGKGSDDSGIVRIAFTSADPPAKLIDYYAKSAGENGFTTDAPQASGGETRLSGKKKEGEKSFALAVTPHGAGTIGSITVMDK